MNPRLEEGRNSDLPPCFEVPDGSNQTHGLGGNLLRCEGLGEAWFRLVELTVQTGAPLSAEGLELLGVQTVFPATGEPDELIARFGDRQLVAEMQKVFFAEGANALGHSYAGLMRGPDGRNDLSDVIALLRAEPSSKRAVVTLCGAGGGKVPCVNVIQFLVREGAVQVIYFARGQDAFKKFYADGLCLAKLAQRVAAGLGIGAATLTGFIGSSHIYHSDRPAIDRFLAAGRQFLPNAGQCTRTL
jgi:hypothetical protein